MFCLAISSSSAPNASGWLISWVRLCHSKPNPLLTNLPSRPRRWTDDGAVPISPECGTLAGAPGMRAGVPGIGGELAGIRSIEHPLALGFGLVGAVGVQHGYLVAVPAYPEHIVDADVIVRHAHQYEPLMGAVAGGRAASVLWLVQRVHEQSVRHGLWLGVGGRRSGSVPAFLV